MKQSIRLWSPRRAFIPILIVLELLLLDTTPIMGKSVQVSVTTSEKVAQQHSAQQPAQSDSPSCALTPSSPRPCPADASAIEMHHFQRDEIVDQLHGKYCDGFPNASGGPAAYQDFIKDGTVPKDVGKYIKNKVRVTFPEMSESEMDREAKVVTLHFQIKLLFEKTRRSGNDGWKQNEIIFGLLSAMRAMSDHMN